MSSYPSAPDKEMLKEADARHLAGGMFGPQEIAKMKPAQYSAVLHSVAGLQRGLPELMMNKLQAVSGNGGVFPYAVEHTGDLIHRMAEDGGSYGSQFVRPKIQSVHRVLTHGYGFQREMNENIDHMNLDVDKIKRYSNAYGDTHQALPAYTFPMHYARGASVALGRHMFHAATDNIERIKQITDNDPNDVEWRKQMGQDAAVDYLNSKAGKSGGLAHSDQHADPAYRALVRAYNEQRDGVM